MGLGNEAGEVQGKIKKMLRDGTFNKDAIAAEIGDVLWYIAALCRDLEIDMAEVALKNLSKLKSRQGKRNIKRGITDDRYIHGYVHIVLCDCRSHMGFYEGIINELLYYQRFDMAFSFLCIRNSSTASVTGGQQEIL